ncbi:MAG: M56 family metallopeptidase [Parvularculaceae bacterium]
MPATERAAASAPAMSFDMALNAAGLIYIYGALLAFGVYFVRGALFARQVHQAKPVEHPELLKSLSAVARRLDVKENFSVRRSDAVSTVCVFGAFRPVILLPQDIEARLSFQDLVLMGAHELAHVKRGDATLFTFAAVLRIVFWFNPFIRHLAARAELAAEQGADALVLSMGADRRRYAACFIEGLKFAAERAQLAHFATPSFTPFDRQSRRDRLNAILTGEMRDGRPLKLAGALAAVLAFGAAFAQAGLAVTPEIKVAAREPVTIDTREGRVMRSPFDGVVVEATDVYRGKPSLGKVVVIKHDDKRSTQYARLKSYSVKKGDQVRRGDAIGIAGKDMDVTITTGARAAAPVALAAPVVAAAPLADVADAAEPAETEPVVAVWPDPASPEDKLDSALEGGQSGTSLGVSVLADAWVKSEDRWFECGARGAVCEFTVPKNSTHVLMATGPRTQDLRWSGCKPSENGKSCSVSVGKGPARVLVWNKNDQRALLDEAFAGGKEIVGSNYAFVAPSGAAYVFETKDGKTELVFKKADGSYYTADGRELSKEEKERFEKKFEGLKEKMRDQGTEMNSWFQFDGAALENLREQAALDASELAARLSRTHALSAREQEKISRTVERAMRDAERAIEKSGAQFDQKWFSRFANDGACDEDCRADAEQEREQALAEAAQERAEALAEAEAAREEALAEAQAAREEALAEAQAERAEAEEERHQIEEEIRERAESLAEAERSLAEERADLERLKAELAAKHEKKGATW